MHRHYGTTNWVTRWTFMYQWKPGSQEVSASSAWLAALSMNVRNIINTFRDSYFFVSHSVMKDRGSSCKCRNARSVLRKFTRGSSVFQNTMRKKGRIQSLLSYIYTLSKFFRFSNEISILIHKRAVFRTTAGSYVTGTVSSKNECQNFLRRIHF